MGINYYPSCFSTCPGTGLVFTDIQVPGTTPGIPDLPMWDQPLPGAVGPVPVFHAHTSLTPCSSCTGFYRIYLQIKKTMPMANLNMNSKGYLCETQAIQYNSFSLSSKYCCLICITNIISYNTIQWSVVSIYFLFLHSTQTFTPRVLRFGARLSVIYAFDHIALFVCNHLMMMMMRVGKM